MVQNKLIVFKKVLRLTKLKGVQSGTNMTQRPALKMTIDAKNFLTNFDGLS